MIAYLVGLELRSRFRARGLLTVGVLLLALLGLSTWIGYTANEGKFLTLAMMEPGFAEPGTEVTLLWGEQNGGTSKPTVEPHVQTEIKAVVSPVPYVAAARDNYAEGWRKHWHLGFSGPEFSPLETALKAHLK